MSHGQVINSISCADWAERKGTCVTEADGTTTVSVTEQGTGGYYSKHSYVFGTFSVRLKLASGYSGGVIMAFYLVDTITPNNTDPRHTEIDFEFFGNVNSSAIMLATTVYAGGMRFQIHHNLHFDAAADYHTYTIQWNDWFIAWLVDDIPYRFVFRGEDTPWPLQPMQVEVTTWDCSSWCSLKANYSNGPISLSVGPMPFFLGCIAPNAWDTPTQCTSWVGPPYLPWQQSPTPEQLAGYFAIQKQTLLQEYGWGKVHS